MTIKSILEEALKLATPSNENLLEKNKKAINRDRSKRLVEKIGEVLRLHFTNNDSIKVFTKHYNNNRKEFGLNELLYDVLVCETSSTNSVQGIPISYVTKAPFGGMLIEASFRHDCMAAVSGGMNTRTQAIAQHSAQLWS
ncbi:MAG: hypothetical protein DWQ33_02265 [Bacteroidetes bacterium]|nr:MAG: hypothetical protein DWQ33_02265 [Bacteroidota bacterium]